MKIKKRGGYLQDFNTDKIVTAIKKTFEDTHTDIKEDDLASIVLEITSVFLDRFDHISVEDIQDMIEDGLMTRGYLKEAKEFIKFRQERTRIRNEGWKLDELQKAIWENKYRYENETFDEWLERVSGGNPKISKLIRQKKFIFAGRILAHRGLQKFGKRITYSNCYVMSPPEDNIESIFDTARDMARTYSAGGGVGVDISKLRPKGMDVNNSAKTTSGATSFMSLYDLTTDLIGQNGRRGALMISIDSSHPDIEHFIDIKTEQGAITKANISIKVDDAFMMAVINDTDYTLHWEGENGLKLEKVVNARKLYMKNVKNNWDWAEAGFLFWNTISKNHMMSNHPEHKFAGTNPCLHPDSMIETVEGRVRIADIKEPIGVYTMLEDGSLGIKTATASWISKKDAQTINVTTRNGKTIRVTPDHKVMTHNGWVEAKDLKIGDRIVQLLRRRRGVAYSGVRLTTQKNGTDVMEHRLVANYATLVTKEDDVHHIDGNTYNNSLSNLQVLTHSEHSTLTRFSCDNNHQIHGENGDFVCGNGEYQKTIIPMPIELQSHMINQHCNEVVSIELGDVTDVYDLTVEDTHNFIADYMVVHNCAEEPLMAGGSCLLGSINLSEFVVHPFTDDAYFDKVKFKEAVETSVEGLNEVLDEGLTLHPLDIQQQNARDWRQIGLGVMGVADMFIKLGVEYGSELSFDISEQIAVTLKNSAIKKSAELACEHGAFPKFRLDSILDSEWFRLDLEEEVLELVKEYGIRNSQILTIAPTGSISTMWGISGGIEPIFAKTYKRKTESIHGSDVYYDVFTPIVNDAMNKLNTKEMPHYIVTSHDLDWKDRIKMQSIWQTYIDASISSTVNLPKETTVEQCAELFIQAWKQGLKGITIFRDGCKRTGILTVDEDDAETSAYEADSKYSKCPECGEQIEVIQGACSICMNCGHSGCN